MTRPDKPVSGLESSGDLKARIVDFMERANELQSHPLSDYKAPYTLTVTARAETGQVLEYKLNHNLVDKEPLVYLATMLRPIVFTESEPIYLPTLVNAIGREHPALRPHCAVMGNEFKLWKRRLYIGVQSTAQSSGDEPVADWRLKSVQVAPVGTQLPNEIPEADLVEDFYYARIYLNGFVWHSDSAKTAEYRAASELMQDHYRKCAEIRVFSAIQGPLQMLQRYIIDARHVGEDF